MSIEHDARIFALAAHGAVGQKRKYTDQVYFVHPDRVAKIIKKFYGAHSNVVAAAYLHDVLEDTEIQYATIKEEFNPEVAEMVWELSDFTSPAQDGNRKQRVDIYIDKLKKASVESQDIKRADIFDNVRDIVQNDPDFARVYIKERFKILDAMNKGKRDLKYLAWNAVKKAETELKDLDRAAESGVYQ